MLEYETDERSVKLFIAKRQRVNVRDLQFDVLENVRRHALARDVITTIGVALSRSSWRIRVISSKPPSSGISRSVTTRS